MVEALHPATVLHVPRNMRKARLDVVTCQTPVEVLEASAGDVDRLPESLSHHSGFASADLPRPRLHRVAGTGSSVWGVMRDTLGVIVARSEFLATLRNEVGDPEEIPAISAHGTPLRALGHPDERHAAGPGSRGSRGDGPFDPAMTKGIERDGRDRAAAAVRRYVADAFRLHGDVVLVRQGFRARGYVAGVFEPEFLEEHAAPRLRHPMELVVGAADHAAALAYANEHGRVRARGTPVAEAWRELTGGEDAGAGSIDAANSLPAHLRRIMGRCLRRRVGWGHADEVGRLRAAMDDLLPLEIDGMTGTCADGGRHEVEDVLRLVLTHARMVGDLRGQIGTAEARNDSSEISHARGMASAIEHVYLPGIPVPALDEADAEAIATLGGP